MRNRVFVLLGVLLVVGVSVIRVYSWLIYCDNQLYNHHLHNLGVTVIQDLSRGPGRVVYKAKSQKRGYLRLKFESTGDILPGDKLIVSGVLRRSEPIRNPGEFDYNKYNKYHLVLGDLLVTKWRHDGVSLLGSVLRVSAFMKTSLVRVVNSVMVHPYSTLLLSFVIGSGGEGLPSEIVNLFRDLGLIHIMVVSGAQVSLLSGLIWSGLGVLQFPKWGRLICLGGCQLVFLGIVGDGASVCRAIIMFDLVLGMLVLRRRYMSMMTILILTLCLMIMWNPFVLFDVGAWLSFGITFGFLWGVPSLKRYRPRWISESLYEWMLVLIVPFLASFPILLVLFNKVSLISIIANGLVVMVVELVLICCVILLGIGWLWPSLQALGLMGLQVVLEWLVVGLQGLQGLWWGSLVVGPVGKCVLIGLWVWVMAVLIFWRLPRARLFVSCVGVMGFGLSVFWILFQPNRLVMTMLDVGQGEAIVLQVPGGRVFLIDVGDRREYRDRVYDYGVRVVVPSLDVMGINKLDGIILSHLDQDHIGGLDAVLAQKRVGAIFIPKCISGDDKCAQFITKYSDEYPVFQLNSGSKLSLGPDCEGIILGPSLNSFGLSRNNRSLVMKLVHKNVSILLTGDMEKEEEFEILSEFGDLVQSTVLKVAHHGSRSSTVPIWLKIIDPELALISVGNRNLFGHPSLDVIERLGENAVKILRTDRHGAIRLESDGEAVNHSTWLRDDR